MITRRDFLKGLPAPFVIALLARIPTAEAEDLAYNSTFTLLGYTNENGLWTLEFLANTPPPGSLSNIFIQIPEAELPSNINQNTLATTLKNRLGWKLNQTFAPLNQFITNGTTVTLP